MKRTVALAVALLLAWTLPAVAAEESPDAVIKDLVKTMKDATTVLKTIKDQKTAEAAKPKLLEVGKKFQDVRSRLKKLNLSDEQKKELQNKHKDEVMAAQKDLGQEVMRVYKIDGGKEAVATLMGGPRPAPKEEKKPDKK